MLANSRGSLPYPASRYRTTILNESHRAADRVVSLVTSAPLACRLARSIRASVISSCGHVHAIPSAIPKTRGSQDTPVVETPLFASYSLTSRVLDRRVRSFASPPHARYLLIVVARWKPASSRFSSW